jgi:hypothetical protein
MGVRQLCMPVLLVRAGKGVHSVGWRRSVGWAVCVLPVRGFSMSHTLHVGQG